MPRIVLSWITLIWISLSIFSLSTIWISLISSPWLVRTDSVESRLLSDCPTTTKSPSFHLTARENSQTSVLPPSIGPWMRCQSACSPQTDLWAPFIQVISDSNARCQLAMWGFGNRPAKGNGVVWAAAGLCLFSCIFLSFSEFFVILSLCKREIGGRSMLSVTGSLQGFADLLLIFGLLLWPIGWESVTVREVCGGSVGPYSRGNCTIGWAPVCAGVGALLLFICALLAMAVDKSITTHAATRQMLLEGKTCVFVH
ncbi:lipoma HMGIC fusion partner-like 2 protein [Clonorchis sinensis]|uniref:Lipoma HMGIC fusion partner-like 2 protein n=2 Tax=Clonorchis sinensis TaxID=79923 RepID=G7YHW8_CLOSI|nr:lipoma HMGIC fusion partner-like 2 protein [Clonorchis sinensis]